MNDEIKEILDNLRDYCKIAIDNKIVLCNRKEMIQLLDYITNLQQRCEYLERSNNRREDEIMSLRDEGVDGETYITNLQEENEKLKKQNIKLYKKDIKEINKLKLKQTKEVFDKLAYLINTNETCSYRFLIYDLLGFQKKDYIDLISGLVITNMLVDYQDYKSRNEKAIEILESDDAYSMVEYALKILKGKE